LVQRGGHPPGAPRDAALSSRDHAEGLSPSAPLSRAAPVLREAVDAILSHTAALLRLDASTEASARVLDIQEHALRLSRVADVLSIYCGRYEPEPSAVDLDRLAAEAVELMEYQFRKAGASLAYSPGGVQTAIPGDAALLKQALMALLGNAIEAMEHWPGPREVSVSTEAKADGVSIRVADTGPGMGAGERERACEPFFTTRPGRIGLGLSLADGVARLHGGTLTIGGTPGGCEVEIRLPVREAPEPLPSARRSRGGRPRVLVVDDEPLVLDVISEMLETLGCEVECVLSSDSAVERLRQGGYDALFIDFFMPGMNGQAFLEHAEREGRLPPVAVLTGDATMEGVVALRRGRDLPLLEKPFSFDDLKSVLHRLLGD